MNKDILAKKEADVNALAEKMEAASSQLYLVEYRGLISSGSNRTSSCIA